MLGSLILVDALTPGDGGLGWIVITGLVTVPVLLRVVRGSVPDAEAEMLDRVRAHMGRRSRFYGRQITKSLNRDDPILESGERVIVELHRHPLAMISPGLIGMVLFGALRGIGLAVRPAFSHWVMFIVYMAGAAGLVWFVWTYRFWVLSTIAVVLLVAFCVYVRLWRVQTVIVTDRNLIRFSGIRAKPSRIPRSGPYELRLAQRSVGSRVLSWLRIVRVPWDTIEVVQMFPGTDPRTNDPVMRGRAIGEVKGLIGAKVALEQVAFALEWKPRLELEPPE